MPNILTMSGPSHAFLRKGIDSNLSAESVNGFIRPIIRRCIDAVREKGRPTSPPSWRDGEPEGAPVAIVLASANRDEGRFEDADRFNLDRPRKQHAAFGYRPHFCSGHYLSGQIGKMSLEETFRSLANLRLDPSREVVTKGWRFRGVMTLPALWDA